MQLTFCGCYVFQGPNLSLNKAAMRRHLRLTFERLDSRDMYSGDSALLSYLASHQPTASAPPSAQQLASTAVSQRWDWLADTVWYVPPENELAYSLTSNLTDPTPVADQTLWFIDQSQGGQFSGVALIQLSSEPLQERNLSGNITPNGQVRITFSSVDPNQARRLVSGRRASLTGCPVRNANGQWQPNHRGPLGLPVRACSGYDSARPDERALRRRFDRFSVELVVRHALGFGGQYPAGERHAWAFTINAYENGYFWGSGTTGAILQRLRFRNARGQRAHLGVGRRCGSHKPGRISRANIDGRNHDAAYEDAPGMGLAWSVPVSLMGVAGFLPPSDVANFATPGQSPSVQALGQNAFPATDVPATWPAAGALSNATPWALVDGTIAARAA